MWESQVLLTDAQVVFPLGSPVLTNDQLDISEIFLIGSVNTNHTNNLNVNICNFLNRMPCHRRRALTQHKHCLTQQFRALTENRFQPRFDRVDRMLLFTFVGQLKWPLRFCFCFFFFKVYFKKIFSLTNQLTDI